MTKNTVFTNTYTADELNAAYGAVLSAHMREYGLATDTTHAQRVQGYHTAETLLLDLTVAAYRNGGSITLTSGLDNGMPTELAHELEEENATNHEQSAD